MTRILKLLIRSTEQEYVEGNLKVSFKYPTPIGRCCGAMFHQTTKKFEEPRFMISLGQNPTLSDWIPEELTDANRIFFRVDREQDPIRLAGVRYKADFSSGVAQELETALALMAREGAYVDVMLLSSNLFNEMNEKFYIFNNNNNQNVTYIGDPQLPVNTAYMLTLNTWNYDKILTCNAPGDNGVVTFK